MLGSGRAGCGWVAWCWCPPLVHHFLLPLWPWSGPEQGASCRQQAATGKLERRSGVRVCLQEGHARSRWAEEEAPG